MPVVSHHCWQVKVLERHRGNFPSNFLFPDPSKYSIKGSETDCRSVQATDIRVRLQQRSNCETNCCLPCNLLLLQLHPNLLICPTPSLIRAGNGEFLNIQPFQIFGSVLLGGDLLGRGRGVIEVTKRGEVNIPDIPGCSC